VSHLKIIGGSPSSALLWLRILSEAAAVALAALIAATFEHLQWLLTGRGDGACFLDYLSLQAGSGLPGLLGVMLWKGGINMTTRLWSLTRLVSIALLPILNIVAMSKCKYIKFASVPSTNKP
jgi:hypothetical protein